MKEPIQRTLSVKSSAYPNGDVVAYAGNQMPYYQLLPSNHPLVLAEAKRRIPKRNTLKPKRTLRQEAGVIIEMASKKLERRAKG